MAAGVTRFGCGSWRIWCRCVEDALPRSPDREARIARAPLWKKLREKHPHPREWMDAHRERLGAAAAWCMPKVPKRPMTKLIEGVRGEEAT